MFDNPVFDIALGLTFFYLVLSLVATAVQEWIASLLALRSKNLRKGISNLIEDKYAKQVYDHPLIKNLAKKGKLPSYISPQTFSEVLLEVLAKDSVGKSYVACTADEARKVIEKIEEQHPLRQIIESMLDGSDDVSDNLKNKLGGWFDEGMTRVAGWYKRQAQLFLFMIAVVVVIVTNASSVQIVEELWNNDALRVAIAAQAQAAGAANDLAQLDANNLEALKSFPIGWGNSPGSWGLVDWVKTVFGWLITIAAVSLGAPFWFDLLGKVANLRGAGGKADSTSQQKSPAK